MKRTIAVMPKFAASVSDYLSETDYKALREDICINPEKGVVIPGCGGMRKLRCPDPQKGKGKRGGIRIVYLDVPEANLVLLVHLYRKNQLEDISPSEKKHLRQLAKEFKELAQDKARKGTGS